jgi:hypothetical protein
MTKEQAEQFISGVLKGVWTNWETTAFQYTGWIRMLQDYDYEVSENALHDYVVNTEKIYREPNIASIKKMLQRAKNKAAGIKGGGPVHLFTIVKESQLDDKYERGERFYVGTPNQVPDEYCMNGITGVNHVVKYAEIRGKA